MAAKKSGGRRYGKAASKSVGSAMRRRKKGTLARGKGGRGGAVKSREQAIAIGLSEARAKGAKVPAKRKSAAKKGGAKKASGRGAAKKSGGRKTAAKRSTAKKSTAKRSTAKRSGGRGGAKQKSSSR